VVGAVIYELPALDAPIRQGDIFEGIPRIDLSIAELSILNENNQTEVVAWDAIRGQAGPIVAMTALRSVRAIVITQDCDTVRAPDISLCEIKRFADVVKVPAPGSAKKWGDLLVRQAVANLKWFYLPADQHIGFAERMAVDFLATLRVNRDELDAARHMRRGRLNETADEHFRERLSEFFRRYPYNEWYPFTKDEFDAYKAARNEEADLIQPYPYQT